MLVELRKSDVAEYMSTLGHVVDSRGIECGLQKNFAIMVPFCNSVKIDKVNNLCNSKYSDGFIIGIDEEEYNNIIALFEYAERALNNVSGWNKDVSYLRSNLNVHQLLYLQETNRNKSVSQMSMYEISGKELRLGDLVIYFKGNSYGQVFTTGYGICISNTEVYTIEHKVDKVAVVYKPKVYTEDELQISNQLSLEYSNRNLNIQKTKLMNISEGMVFKTDKYLYIYLGYCIMEEHYDRPSDYDLITKLDGTQKYYLKLTDGVFRNMKLSEQILVSTDFFNKVKLENKVLPGKKIINNRVIMRYKTVSIEKSLVSRLPKDAVYVGQINPYIINYQVIDDITVRFVNVKGE
jgi:hypothetical protein